MGTSLTRPSTVVAPPAALRLPPEGLAMADPRHDQGTALTRRPVIDGGFSRARLARLHATMRRHLDEDQIPGLIALVHHRGREHLEAIGTLTLDGDAPMRRDTIFRLASMTKPVTAVSAMILVEECKIRLDDPVDTWLPELKEPKVLRTIESSLDDTVPAKRRITLRDLLTFRSGYGEVGFIAPTSALQQAMIEARLPLSVWPYAGTPEEFMRILGTLPLAFQPGERWLYHMGSEILGVLVARVSGTPLATFLDERIFAPLGMKDTSFYVPEEKLDRLATCYGTDFVTGQFGVLDEARGGSVSRPPLFESGGGGLVSTVDDMLVFGQMLLAKGAYGRERILSRPAVELMTTDQLTAEQKAASPFFENFWSSRGWGLGVSMVTGRQDIADVPGRFGWDGAFGTSWYVDPKEELVGVLMTQRRPDMLQIPEVILDFWTSAYQLIDD
jgi:CubicO group peptidase (beta-lactamase class C family)